MTVIIYNNKLQQSYKFPYASISFFSVNSSYCQITFFELLQVCLTASFGPISTVKNIENIKRKKEFLFFFLKKKNAATKPLMAGGYKSSYIRKKSAAKS